MSASGQTQGWPRAIPSRKGWRKSHTPLEALDLMENHVYPRRPLGVRERASRVGWYTRSSRVDEHGGVLFFCKYPANEQGREIVLLLRPAVLVEQDPSKEDT